LLDRLDVELGALHPRVVKELRDLVELVRAVVWDRLHVQILEPHRLNVPAPGRGLESTSGVCEVVGCSR